MKRRSGFLSRRFGYSCWVVSMASPILPDKTSFWISGTQQHTCFWGNKSLDTEQSCKQTNKQTNSTSVCGGGTKNEFTNMQNTEALTLSVFDGGQLLVHGLVSGFGEGLGGGTVAVVHQVGSHHPNQKNNTLYGGDHRDSTIFEELSPFSCMVIGWWH